MRDGWEDGVENNPTEFVEMVMAAQPWIKSLIESIYDGVLIVDMAPTRYQGQIVGGISTVKEIARIQALSKELEKYAKKNRDLTSVVSHIYHARYTFQDIVGAFTGAQGRQSRPAFCGRQRHDHVG